MRHQKWILGIDEAGYGPNLGPLCLGGTLWRVDADQDVEQMASTLSPTFQAKSSDKQLTWIPLGDSKKLYKSGGSLTTLSAGLLAMENLRAPSASCFELEVPSLDRWLSFEDQTRIGRIPWFQRGVEERADLFPSMIDAFDSSAMKSAKKCLEREGIELIAIRTRVFEESEFNRLLDVHGNKSNLLSIETLAWIRSWIVEIAGEDSSNRNESVEIFCDKHGGRNHYQGPLTHIFPETWFATDQESTPCSRYRGEIFGRKTAWRFTAKGDSIAPASAASMVAKWTREVLMDRLNRYWIKRLPNLRPTAGYPLDAKRFGTEIEGATIELGLDRSSWWRRV